MNKKIRSVSLLAIDHGPALGVRVDVTVQRVIPNESGSKYYAGAEVVCNSRNIKSKLRMMRCLWLQSAFLAQGGKVLL